MNSAFHAKINSNTPLVNGIGAVFFTIYPKMGENATWQPGAWEFRCYVFSTESDDTMVCV